jgi:hypothetical protein
MGNPLYQSWFRQIQALRPRERVTRVRNMGWMMVGIYESRSVQLSKVAGKIPGPAKLLSTIRRLARFLDNPAIRVREWYLPIAQAWLAYLATTVGEIRLIADGTKVGFGHQLLMIAVAFQRRTIPIAWTWVPCRRGHSSAYKQLALLSYVRGLVPAGVPVLLVGDSEFGAVAVMRQMNKWHWYYVVRQKATHQVKLRWRKHGQAFGSMIQTAGQSFWWEAARLTTEHSFRVNLLAHWVVGEKEPWLLATNLPTRQLALQAYKRRMWIEEMFGDMKKHGFDLESTHLQHFLRLSRLTLIVALLYVWLLTAGATTIKNGHRHWVDRRERRDLSLFQIGWRSCERKLINGQHLTILLCPGESLKLSGS